MIDCFVIGNNLPEAYHNALVKLFTSDTLEISATIKVLNPLSEPRISRCFPGGARELEQYVQEMRDGILDFETDLDLWHYTYHQRFAPWLDGVVEELKRDPHSRRAVISICDNAEDEGSTDPACLQSIQYMIRDGALDCFVYFRSNDAVRAAFMNMYALIELQTTIAERLGVPVGEYTHRANSFHCYPESKTTLAGYCKRILESGDVTYRYDTEFKALMDAEKPKIMEMVARQKRKWESAMMQKEIDEIASSLYEPKARWLKVFSIGELIRVYRCSKCGTILIRRKKDGLPWICHNCDAVMRKFNVKGWKK